MAGPRISILFNRRLSARDVAAVKKYVADRSSATEDEYFWIHEHPFTLYPGIETGDDLSEYDANGTAAMIGWAVQDLVELSALCDSQKDHLILGEIAHWVASELNGLLDFHGKLSLPDFPFPGELLLVESSSDAATEQVRVPFHIGDATFLKNWIKSDYFKLIKEYG